MKLSTPFLFILAAIGAVEAIGHDGVSRLSARHHNVARNNNAVEKRASSARCKVRPTSSLLSTLAASSTHTSSTHASSTHASSTHTSTPKTTSTKKATSTAASTSKSSGDNSSSADLGSLKQLIDITDSSCGSPGATEEITPTHGPNGNIDWLNCGVTGAGWTPPHVTVNDVVTVDLNDALKDSNSPFKACSQYIDLFTKYANEHGVPPIMIASIAMQESSCDPSTVGGGGEQGLMQITKDKCGGAPNGNCKDVDFNIKTGTAFFAQTLNDNGGSLLLTLGNYNGWPEKMTIASATAAKTSSCCRCQNNLDYLMQQVNGWFLNKDPYTSNPPIGKYFNLDVCGNDD